MCTAERSIRLRSSGSLSAQLADGVGVAEGGSRGVDGAGVAEGGARSRFAALQGIQCRTRLPPEDVRTALGLATALVSWPRRLRLSPTHPVCGTVASDQLAQASHECLRASECMCHAKNFSMPVFT